jgi:hypothetical protein
MIRKTHEIKTRFGELSDAAFQRAAEDVLRIAQQTGTPVLAWDEHGRLKTPDPVSEDEAAPQDDQR